MDPDTKFSAGFPNFDLVLPEEDITACGIPITLQPSSTPAQSTIGILETHSSSDAESISPTSSSHATDGNSAPRHRSSSHIHSAPTAQACLQLKPVGCEDNIDNHIGPSGWQLWPPGVIDNDIELDDLTPPRSTATTTTTPWHSTVRLISTPPGERPEAQIGLSFRRVCMHGIVVHKTCSSAPDYKPIPLRWPFHAFLFVLIAALLGFLEYQVHDLPPQQAILLELDAVEVHAGAPVPDPIPPEWQYPVADARTLHCEWNGHGIVLQVNTTQPSFDQFNLFERFWIHSTSQDSGWCPCELVDGIGWVSPSDKGCHSVLRALASIPRAHTATHRITYTSPYPTRQGKFIQTTLEKQPEWAGWPAASTDSDGRILLPLEMRTLDAEAVKQTGMSSDVFGNSVTAPDYTGFFHAMFPTKGASALSTTWWAVPMSRPRSTAPVTIRSTAATSGSGIQTITEQAASSSPPSFATQSTGSPDPITQIAQTVRLQSTAPITTKSTSTAPTNAGNTETSTSQAASSSSAISTRHTTRSPEPIIQTAQTVKFQSLSPLHGPIAPTEGIAEVAVVAQSVASSPTPDTGSIINLTTSPYSTTTQIFSPPGIKQINTKTPPAASFSMLSQNPIPSPISSPHSASTQTSASTRTAQGEEERTTSSTDPTPPAHLTSTLIHSYPRPGTSNDTKQPNVINTTRSIPPPIPLPLPTKASAPSSNPDPYFIPEGPIPPDKAASFFNLRTETAFVTASMLPVMLATLLSIPVQILCSALFALLPFRALQQQQGARAEDSLLLPRSLSLVWAAPIVAVRFARRNGDLLPLLGVLLGVLSVVLVPLASEVVRLEFATVCSTDDTAEGNGRTTRACAFGVRGAGAPMRVVEGVLVAMALLVVGMAVLIRRWRTGVAADPWSMASMAGLLTRGRMRDVVREMMRGGRSVDAAGNKRFRLGYAVAGDGVGGGEYYGIRVDDTEVVVEKSMKSILRPTIRGGLPRRKPKPIPPASTITTTSCRPIWRRWKQMAPILALILTVGLLVLILYYENTSLDTPFEAFMDSQSFGVRALFTACGTAVSGFWDYYFSYTFDAQLYHRLATATAKPLTARDSILLSPPSHVFAIRPASITSTITRRTATRQDALAIAVAIAALLARFTPILFSNIPFRNTVTWKMHETCTWMSVAVLAYMVVVLSLALRRKKKQIVLPVDPDTIAACMSYLCDSAMIDDFAGLAVVPGKERDRLVSYMGKRYVLSHVAATDEMPGAESAVSEARVAASISPGVKMTADGGLGVRKVAINYA